MVKRDAREGLLNTPCILSRESDGCPEKSPFILDNSSISQERIHGATVVTANPLSHVL